MTPASRAASHMSRVLMAAGSPTGSSRMSTIRGSRSTISGMDLDLVQPDSEVVGQAPGIAGVVRHGFDSLVLGPEGDGVGLDRRVAAGAPAR